MSSGTDDTCQWFMLCTEPATSSVEHLVFGEVPVCDEHPVSATRITARPS